MSELPLPILDGLHQPGITDPQWPLTPCPPGMEEDDYCLFKGGVARQQFLTVAGCDVIARNREELEAMLRELTKFAREQMLRPPSSSQLQPAQMVPKTWRVTITIGLGATLFVTANGDDRFNLRGLRPRELKIPPSILGDAKELDPAKSQNDLIVVVASDHTYVNVSILRQLAHGRVPGLWVKWVEQGFDRPDRKEFLRFDDGIDNLRNDTDARELDSHVYVQARDGEPDWCVNGSYLVYRKIRESVRAWDKLMHDAQEHMIGRRRGTGEPLSRERTGPRNMTPVFPQPPNPLDGPLNAHIRKVQPRRGGTDLFGEEDLSRRFLRRPYPFFEGIDADGQMRVGLHFLAYMRNVTRQFEWVAQMWQMNPDFPVPGTGPDALYANGILSTVRAGYYFCPPAPAGETDYLASGMLRF